MKEKLLLGDILHDYDGDDKRIKEINKENIVLYITRVDIILLVRYKREVKDNKYQHISTVRLLYTELYKGEREGKRKRIKKEENKKRKENKIRRKIK